tara:strand:+ start:103 stop:471 length:369 start_codon:yes stop_codon:yes gene_type:complete
MNNIFKKTGLALIILGIGFYFYSDSGSLTPLIPSILGAIIYALVLLSEKFPNQHKHFAHANLFLFAMGCGATGQHVLPILNYIFKGIELENALKSIENFTAFMLCLAAIVAGIKSFRDARKK